MPFQWDLDNFQLKIFISRFSPRFRLFSGVFGRFLFRRMALSRPPPLSKTSGLPTGSPLSFSIRNQKKIGKIIFPIPTATNRFQIRNLHHKKHGMKKWKHFFLYDNKTNFGWFKMLCDIFKENHLPCTAQTQIEWTSIGVLSFLKKETLWSIQKNPL